MSPARPTVASQLYVLNAAAVTKSHAIEHLATDLLGYKTDIAAITETHLKKKHTNELFDMDGYALHQQQQQQPFNGRLSGTTRVGRYQKKHLPTHTHPGQRTSFITFLHLQRSTASSLFSLHA